MSSSVRFLLRWLIAVLASIAIARTPTAFSAPAATGEGLSITLSPSEGPPGTGVHVGFESCLVITPGSTSPADTTGPTTTTPNPTGPTTPPSGPTDVRGVRHRDTHAPGTITYLTWDGHDLPFTPSVTDGTGSAEFQVPDTAGVGPHSVTAGCAYGRLVVVGSGTFTVTTTDSGSVTTPSHHRPLIALNPSEGRPGTSLRVHGAGFEDCVPSGKPDTVELSTNGQIHARVRVSPGTGTFEKELRITDDAAPGDYPMTATCARHRDVHAEATFTVLPGDKGRPVLVLDPTAGESRTAVTATGSGFNCPSVDVAWDDNTTLAVTAVSDDGTFATDFQVPADAPRATHTVRAACTAGSGTSVAAGFTVTGPGPTADGSTSPTDGTSTDGTDGTPTPVGWIVGPSAFAAVLLALAATSFLLNHRHPGPRWVRQHIRTAPRPGAGTADLHEQRDTGSVNRTVRLEPHADPGDQSLE